MDLKGLKIGFVGGGNMAHAIADGLIEKGVLDPKNIWVSARTEATLESWKKKGVSTSVLNCHIVDACNVIFIAVKPQMLAQAVASFSSCTSLRERKLFVSVLVGVTLETLRAKIRKVISGPFGLVRTMPSTPLMVGAGITVYCTDEIFEEGIDDCSLVRDIFSHLGVAKEVPESQMNPISALSGCGPAFAYQIIEALSDGAVMVGVPREMATQFAAQVLIGAGKMVLETKKHPGQLKDEVCSPGGTTITGVHAMEEGGVRASLMNAIKAAVARSEELSIQIKQ